jgi:hypothetical protein
MRRRRSASAETGSGKHLGFGFGAALGRSLQYNSATISISTTGKIVLLDFELMCYAVFAIHEPWFGAHGAALARTYVVDITMASRGSHLK